MELLVVRHGRAQLHEHGPDSDRRLTSDGIEELQLASRTLATWTWRPQGILTSPYIRTQQTAAILQSVWPACIPTVEPALGSGATAEDMLGCFVRFGRPAVMVGHMPDVSLFVARCVGSEARSFEPGSMALLSFSRVALGEARLVWHHTAREIATADLATLGPGTR